jgi:diaminohydroxyphosphoribosylaminopyrimidine deaminase/5-amino-6-(5-phosphoribosylamino)uracil reductase
MDIQTSGIDDKFMKRCIELGKMGAGNTSPNPMVGAVIVHNNRIISEGFHQKSGTPHAEVNALRKVKAANLLPESTMYVNLEPCSHHGRTPPCTAAIIEHQIPKVVIGSKDSNTLVAGKGIDALKRNGIEVIEGVMEKQCRKLNRRFFIYHEQKRPYIILKWAQTQDGYIDYIRGKGQPKEPTWITEPIARSLVHKWRAEEQAILIGTNTAEKDNPSLTTRQWCGDNPLRLVIDKNLRLPDDLALFDNRVPTIIFNEKKDTSTSNLTWIKINFEADIVPQILSFLYKINILSVIVEGGQLLLNSFIKRGLWDEARVFKGNKFFKNGIEAPKLTRKPVFSESLKECTLFVFENGF